MKNPVHRPVVKPANYAQFMLLLFFVMNETTHYRNRNWQLQTNKQAGYGDDYSLLSFMG